MERRIEETDRHRQTVHGLEDPYEVPALQRRERPIRRGLLLLGGREDHRSHSGHSLLAEEHVLGPAQADPLGATGQGLCRLVRRIRVGPHSEPPGLVGPLHERLEGLPNVFPSGLLVPFNRPLQGGIFKLELLQVDGAVRTVDGDPVAFGDPLPF